MINYSRFHTLSNEDRRTLMNIRDIIDIFLELDRKMPLIYVRTFIEVALNPGKGSTAYGSAIGTGQPQMSRLLLEIGPQARFREHGLKLIDQMTSPDSAREKQAYLTPAGMTLMYDIIRRMD